MALPDMPQSILTEPVTDGTAWTAADLSVPEGVVHELTPLHLAEVAAFMSAWRAAPLTLDAERALWRSFAYETMPELSDVAHAAAHRTETHIGTAVLRGLPVDDLSPDEISHLYRALGAVMGNAVSQNTAGEFIAAVRDYGNGGLDNSNVRGHQTTSALRFHSDDGDLALLLCVRPAEIGGTSLIASAMTIYNELLRRAPHLLGLYYNGFVYENRDEEDPPAYRNAVFGYYHGQLTCRYFLRDYVDSAWTQTSVPVSDLERHALDLFEALAARPGAATEYALRAGDLQLVNNNVVVHSRRSFTDATADGRKRLLLRQWVNLDGGRQFPATLCRHRYGMRKRSDART
ncbi:TauD/TfdA family dioxygenase [Streptomyces sp. ISL-10]|uniref:TauD/TfdA family dioxygenase n=1 Tax=Streptomyces sp. ISL-10 TaxID=2819172 RepID=UPI001BE6A98E|nr:TauD/TfdA family dioxygenase [Streptomyces sp. ISL-10]MBT2363971.1 TauD/TfdA family dioxygenase [Streptomyces sp. ISL-10]